jgi:hypothetical protein
VIVLAAGRVRLEGRLDDLTRPVAPLLRLDVAGSVDACAAHLAAVGIRATRIGSAALHLPTQDAAGLERVWQAAREAGVVVQALTPVQERFEDVFLQAIAQPEEAAHAAS